MSKMIAGPEEYFRRFAPHRAGLLSELEEEAAGQGIPIVGPVVAELLFILARGIGARTILELGTATGYSAIHLAEACADGSGKVITVEHDQGMAQRARENIRRAGLEERVEVRVGAAFEVLEGMSGPVDLIFMDIDKGDYAGALSPCRKLLREGGLLFVDNTAFEGAREFNQAVASDPGWRYVQLLSFLPGHSPERDGLCLALRL
jgi:caffeoyl-CoA O-methyltransferase